MKIFFINIGTFFAYLMLTIKYIVDYKSKKFYLNSESVNFLADFFDRFNWALKEKERKKQ